ncbi:MAG: VWA domain-containing protein [Acidobacteriota bacterium]
MRALTRRLFVFLAATSVLAGASGSAAEKAPRAGGPVGIASWGPGSSYIESAIDDTTGQFTMGVPGGPVLVYGHPYPGTSFSSVKVDGTVYTNDGHAFGTLVQAPTTVGLTNEGIWYLGAGPLKVHQKITLVTSATTGHQDTYLIEYKVGNNDSVSHTVGVRVMLDTMIGDNDNAPFQVPGTGSISNETEWAGASVPPYFFVFDDLYNPTVTCQGTLLGGQVATPPDRFQVAYWSNIYGTEFDYTVNPGATIYDTAYAPYWVDRVIPPGTSVTFGTYYGLGSVAVNTTPPLATALTAPATLDCLLGQFSPNPFTASLYLSNTLSGASGTVTGVTATLSLPAGLSLASGTLTQTVGDLALGASSLKSWNIRATGDVTGTLTYSILVSSTNLGSKTVTGQVYVPPGCVQAGCGTYIVTDDNENNARTGTPDGDWNTCVWNSDGNHPIEFNVPVTGALPAASAKLLLLCNDVDETSGEVDEVYFNGHLLGTLTGANNQDSTTVFTIPNLSWVLAGNNYVEIHVDVDDTGWCVYMKQAQIVIDGGCPATASCRTIDTDQSSYDFGEEVIVTTEADTTLASQEIRIETNILDPFGVNVAGDDTTFTTYGSANDPATFHLYLPSSGDSGLYTVESLIFDTASGLLQTTCQTTIAVGSVSNCPATFLLNQVDASACPTVKAVVSVLDALGNPVTGLPASAFCLTEDGVPITGFTVTSGSAGAGDLYTALVLDNSGSLGSTAFNDEKTAAKAFLALLGSTDQASVYGFTSTVDLVMDFTTDKAALGAAVDGYPYKGGMTAFYDGVYQALSNTSTRNGRKAVIAMTDGEDNSSAHSQAELIAYAQGLGIPVFTIGFGSADATVLDAIATQTGGKYFAAATSANLQTILQSIGAIVNSQYVITYTTTKTDGQSHTLVPCVNVPGCTLLTAQGSFQCGSVGTCPTLIVSQVDTSTCPTVKVVVTVTNPSGQAVTGLTASNFCLSEDGTSKTFTLSTGSAGGNNLFLALNLDNSGSLGSTAFADEKTAAQALIGLLGTGDQGALYGFTSSVDLVQDFTADQPTLLSSLAAYPYKGGATAFYDSVYQSLSNTAARTGRKAVVAMTDGEDNSSAHTQAELIAYAQSLGIPVFTIGFGSADALVLEAIATQTGGRYYASASSANLQQILTDIGNVINNQYVLTYTTTKNDGQSHALDVCLQNVSGCATVHAAGTMQCGAAGGGNCPQVTLTQVDTSACPAVKGILTVRDAAGNPITGLTASAFCVKEDGTSITNFTVTTASQSGTALYLAQVIDNSGSLGSSAFNDEKTAAKALVNLLGTSDQGAVYGFTSTVDLVQDFTSNKSTLLSAIDGYPYKGGMTAFYDGVWTALTNTASKAGRKAVVAMTDGEDNSSSHGKDELVLYAQSLGIPVYTIAFGSADQAVLEDIATRTGGLFFASASSQNLQQILSAIGALLNSQYVVSYTTAKTDGAQHDLQFCVTYGGCTQWVQGTFRCGQTGACPTISIAQVDTSLCPTVQAVVSVFDSQGQPVQGLTASSFCVNEDGAPQAFTVTGAGQSGSTLYVGVTIDNSGSLGSTQFQLEKDAAKTFVGLLGASDQVAVWGFDSQVDFVIDFTADKQALYAAVDGYAYSGGSTAFFDATWDALVGTAARSGRKAVLAMTDGEDNSSSHSENELIAYAQQARIPIYTIGFGSPDDVVMQRIADQTGGRYYRGTDAGALQQILTDIGNLINNQYVISYDTLYTDGSVHDLEICVTYQGCTAYANATSQCGSPCALTCQASAHATGFTGVPTGFYGQASVSCGSGTPGYEWNFGDGSALSTLQNPTHAYSATGTYTWTFTATYTGAPPCVQTGTITISNATCVKPRITGHPQSQVVNAGQSVTLSVAAQGTTALTYQWYEGPTGTTSSPISGAIQSTYTTPAIQSTKLYWVRVTASCGTSNSQTATLSVASNAHGWGNNNSGEVGDGTEDTDRTSPVGVLGPSGFVQVAAGNDHSLGLTSGGTVWAWGNNGSGELGDGTQTQSKYPKPVAGLSGVVAVAAGNHWSLALKSDGTVWAWGDNGNGNLGDNSTTDRWTPVQVSGLTGVTAIAAGAYHGVARKSNGTVWAWGDNVYGQCGDGGSTDRLTPVQTTGITTGSAVSAGEHHTVILKSDGTVWACGINGDGQCGDNTTTTRRTSVQVMGLTSITAIASGWDHNLAVKSGGTLWVWGDNYYSQLGDGTTTDRRIPVQLAGIANASSVAGGDKHSLLIRTDKNLWAWGTNGDGQLGDGSTATRNTPVQVTAVSGVLQADGGYSHSLCVAFGVSLTATPTAGPAPLAVSFQASATGGTAPISYSWTFGDSGTASGASSSHTYAAAGSYTVQVTATDASGYTARASTTITVSSLAVTVTASPSSPSGAAPLAVDFGCTVTGGTSPYTYSWIFGDGGVSTSADPSAYSYTVPGTYTAYVMVMDNAGNVDTSAPVTVNVYAAVLAKAYARPNRARIGESVSFRVNASGGNGYFNGFTWTFGDGGVGSGANATHAFSAAGTYTAKATVSDSASNSAQSNDVIVKVYGPVAATIIGPTGAGPGVSATFTAGVTGGDGHFTYAWNFGDGATATGASVSHAWATKAAYTVTLTVTDGLGQTATDTHAVQIVDPPVINSLAKKSPPFKIIVNGSNLQSGIQVFINGTQWTSVTYKTTAKVILTGSTLKTAVPKNTPTQFRFVNPDGGEATLTWQWP